MAENDAATRTVDTLGAGAAQVSPAAAALHRAIAADAEALLRDGRARLVIGFRRRGQDRVPAFISNPEETGVLTYDAQCRVNLACYLRKPEVRSHVPLALVAPPAVMRSLILLAAESQLTDKEVLVLGVDGETYHGVMDIAGTAKLLREKYANLAPDEKLVARLKELRAMSARERSAFWMSEFEKCTRCYACRAACPACYCQRCIVERNVPQWISTAAAGHGNYAWNIIRAFHLAGRCTLCGACEAACPQGLPLMLLNLEVAQDVRDEFGFEPGYDPQAEPAIGSWKQEDKQEYIK